MTKREPEMEERTRGRIVYGDAMADEMLTVIGHIEGFVLIDDHRSGERLKLSPKAARELASELNRAARNVA